MIVIISADEGAMLEELPWSERAVPAGGHLFSAGDPSPGLLRLLAGRLRLERSGAAGGVTVLHLVRPGESFAEASLFEPLCHCDAVALSDCRVALLPAPLLRRALASDPRAALALAEHLARRLVQSRARVELLSLRGAEARLLAFLESLPADPEGWRRIEGSWSEAAESLALTREAVYRTLASLQRAGRLERRGGSVRIAGEGAEAVV